MIVSDSTSLIILFDNNRVDLLQNIFPKIYIPKAVYGEICFKSDIDLPDFIIVKEVDTCLETLELLLDKGESEAITLAINKNMPLIIEEKKGRKIALNYGLSVIGFLGILILNIKKEFITKEEALIFLNKIIKNGFRISNKLVNEMLENIN